MRVEGYVVTMAFSVGARHGILASKGWLFHALQGTLSPHIVAIQRSAEIQALRGSSHSNADSQHNEAIRLVVL